MNDISIYEIFSPLSKNFPVKVMPYLSDKHLHMHWHEHIELLFFHGSPCIVTCGSKTYDVQKDDMIVVNSNEVHTFVAKTDNELHDCIILYPDFFKDISFEGIVLQNLIKQDPVAKNCFDVITKEFEAKKIGGDMLIKAKAYELMNHLVRNYQENIPSKTEYDKNQAKLKRVNDILSYIEEHYTENISTATIAKEFYLSESYLCRLLKKEIGVSPVSYINTLRVQKAEVLLKNTNERITSIAMHLGFSDLNYFSRTFKQLTGMTPRQFKHRLN